jgi:flagellar basal body-associated protein FliL
MIRSSEDAPDAMGEELRRWKTVLLFVAMVSACCAVAGYYYVTYAREVTQVPQNQKQGTGSAAAAGPMPSQGISREDTSKLEAQPSRSNIEISVRPVEQFRGMLRAQLVRQLTPIYPTLPELNREAPGTADAGYRDSVFAFLAAAESAPEANQPAMLLAADFMLQALWCPSEQNCEELRQRFAKEKLSLKYSELGGGYFYQHDLLWRVWQEYPATESGEAAFVLLLDSGWDTSGVCAKGSDEFRDVIKQGEAFLEEHPNSPHRALVTHLVGQAYATWWSLSKEPTDGMADYVEPKSYRQGSEQARLKAIEYFERVEKLSPGTPLSEYARQYLPTLRDRQVIGEGYRFFCVYD